MSLKDIGLFIILSGMARLNMSGMDKVLGHDIAANIDGKNVIWQKGMTKEAVVQSFLANAPRDHPFQVY